MSSLLLAVAFLAIAIGSLVWLGKTAEPKGTRITGLPQCIHPQGAREVLRSESEHGWIVEVICLRCGQTIDFQWGGKQ